MMLYLKENCSAANLLEAITAPDNQRRVRPARQKTTPFPSFAGITPILLATRMRTGGSIRQGQAYGDFREESEAHVGGNQDVRSAARPCQKGKAAGIRGTRAARSPDFAGLFADHGVAFFAAEGFGE